DKDHDGGEFDHGEPELDASVGADAAQVDREQQCGENDNPKVGAHARAPRRHVGGGGDHFCTEGKGEAEPVSGAGDVSGEGVEVEVTVDAEASGGGMRACECTKDKGDGPVNEGGGDEAKDGGGTGDFHGSAGAEEESGADETP